MLLGMWAAEMVQWEKQPAEEPWGPGFRSIPVSRNDTQHCPLMFSNMHMCAQHTFEHTQWRLIKHGGASNMLILGREYLQPAIAPVRDQGCIVLIPLSVCCSIVSLPGPSLFQDRESWCTLDITCSSQRREAFFIPESTFSKYKQHMTVYQYNLYYTVLLHVTYALPCCCK